MTKARLTRVLVRLVALDGRFDLARQYAHEALELCPPGQRVDLAFFVAAQNAELEYWAGNFARAEEHGRLGVEDLESRGLLRWLSSEICAWIDPLIELGRIEEAEVHLERAAPWAADDDPDALMRQARSRARLEFARGNLDAAASAAQVAVDHALSATYDDAGSTAETLLVLAGIEAARGRGDDAREAAAQALVHAERRESSLFIGRAREFLAEPVAIAAVQ